MLDTARTVFRRLRGARPDERTHAAADTFAAFAATCDADAHRAAAAFRNWLTHFEAAVDTAYAA